MRYNTGAGMAVYTGSAAFTGSSASLDISGLAPGFYFVHVQDGYGNNYTLKLVKQ